MAIKLEEIINSNKLLSYAWAFTAGVASVRAYDAAQKGAWEGAIWYGLGCACCITLAHINYEKSQNPLRMPELT